jgi:type III secretion protein L
MSDTLNFVPAKKILTAEDLKCVVDATTYQTETRRVLNRVQQETAETMETARREGFVTGYSEGIKNAIDDMSEAVESVRVSLLSAENDLTGIVLQAVEKLIGALDPQELARRAVKRALRDASDAVWVSIHVAPEEHPALISHMSEITAAARGTTIRAIESDPLLKPGEMMLETPKGRVHVGLRQQLARLESGIGRMAT